MGHVQDRWYKTVKGSETGKVARVKTELYGKGMRYKVRYLDPDGKEISRSFQTGPNDKQRSSCTRSRTRNGKEATSTRTAPRSHSGTTRSDGYQVSHSSQQPE
jgi:hypothetical protein